MSGTQKDKKGDLGSHLRKGRKAEIDDFQAVAVVQQDVLQLDVSMNNLRLVAEVEPMDDLLQEPAGLLL
eukprot:scaffold545617_cov34-Prasinocladus_malaysianus.AAC.1